MNFGDPASNSTITLTFFSFFSPRCKPKWSQGRVQQTITNFTGPWDDFIVHGVKHPLSVPQVHPVRSFGFPSFIWNNSLNSKPLSKRCLNHPQTLKLQTGPPPILSFPFSRSQLPYIFLVPFPSSLLSLFLSFSLSLSLFLGLELVVVSISAAANCWYLL